MTNPFPVTLSFSEDIPSTTVDTTKVTISGSDLRGGGSEGVVVEMWQMSPLEVNLRVAIHFRLYLFRESRLRPWTWRLLAQVALA